MKIVILFHLQVSILVPYHHTTPVSQVINPNQLSIGLKGKRKVRFPELNDLQIWSLLVWYFYLTFFIYPFFFFLFSWLSFWFKFFQLLPYPELRYHLYVHFRFQFQAICWMIYFSLLSFWLQSWKVILASTSSQFCQT